MIEGTDQAAAPAEEQVVTPAETVNQILESKGKVEAAAGEKKEAQKPSEEKPKEAPKTEEDKKFAQKFAALTKRDKAARDKEKSLADREKQLEARIAELESKAKPAPEAAKEPIEQRLKKDPFNTLKELGLDFDILTKIALNEGKLTPEMQLKLRQEELDRKYETKLEALERKLADKEAADTAAKEKSARDAAETEFRGSIESHVKADPTNYEMLAIEGEEGVAIVYEVIEKHYEATGKIMSIKEAADEVENSLLEVAKKYTGLSKIKGLFGQSQSTAAKPEQVGAATPPKEGPKTLSNEHASTSTAGKKSGLTREQELAEAMKLIKFNN